MTPYISILAGINPVALPALRIAGTIFLLVNLAAGAYVFRNRHRLFDPDPSVENDIPAVRHLRFEVIVTPWLVLTTLLFVSLIYLRVA